MEENDGFVLQAKEEEQQAAAADVVSPVILQIMKSAYSTPGTLSCWCARSNRALQRSDLMRSLSALYGWIVLGQGLTVRSRMRRSTCSSASPPAWLLAKAQSGHDVEIIKSSFPIVHCRF